MHAQSHQIHSQLSDNTFETERTSLLFVTEMPHSQEPDNMAKLKDISAENNATHLVLSYSIAENMHKKIFQILKNVIKNGSQYDDCVHKEIKLCHEELKKIKQYSNIKKNSKNFSGLQKYKLIKLIQYTKQLENIFNQFLIQKINNIKITKRKNYFQKLLLEVRKIQQLQFLFKLETHDTSKAEHCDDIFSGFNTSQHNDQVQTALHDGTQQNDTSFLETMQNRYAHIQLVFQDKYLSLNRIFTSELLALVQKYVDTTISTIEKRM